MSQRHIFAVACVVIALPLAACSAAGDGASKTGSSSGSTSGNGSPGPGATPGGGTSSMMLPGLNDDEIMMGAEMPETCGAVLPTIYRDFKAFGEPGGHGDFETSARNVRGPDGMLYKGWNDVGCGLVEATLAADGKPIYYAGAADVAPGGPTIRAGVGRQKRVVSGAGCWPSTTGVCNVGTCAPWNFDPPTYAIESATTFNHWYRTAAGINEEIPGELPLVETAPGSGVSVFDSNAFFPIDNQGFGNTPGQQHNYHFTTEIHVKFVYQAQQVFTFRGDDDLWIFVNGKLALDVGGLHEDLEGTIDFDKQAGSLGITPGATYQMDIFHAERQTSESNFRIETNIRCFERVPVK